MNTRMLAEERFGDDPLDFDDTIGAADDVAVLDDHDWGDDEPSEQDWPVDAIDACAPEGAYA